MSKTSIFNKQSFINACVLERSIIMGFRIEDSILVKYTEESGVDEVVIPEGVTAIQAWAFSHCSNIKTLTLPKGIVSIGNLAFSGCASLENIEMPEGIISIGEQVFTGCVTGSSFQMQQ